MPQDTDPLKQTSIGVLPSKPNIEKGISCNLPVDSAQRKANIKWLCNHRCPLQKWTSSIQLGGNPDDSINWEWLYCNRTQYWPAAEFVLCSCVNVCCLYSIMFWWLLGQKEWLSSTVQNRVVYSHTATYVYLSRIIKLSEVLCRRFICHYLWTHRKHSPRGQWGRWRPQNYTYKSRSQEKHRVECHWTDCSQYKDTEDIIMG